MGQNEAGSVVLVGLDRSPGSEAALDWAVNYARGHEQALRVLSVRSDAAHRRWLVYQPDTLSPEEKARDDEEQARVEQDVEAFLDSAIPADMRSRIDSVVRAGEPAGELVNASKSVDVSLVVLGRRGRGGFASLLLGSVSDQCAAYGLKSTVVIPTNYQPPSAARVVVGVDGSPDADAAIRWAGAHARATGGTVILMAAWRSNFAAGSSEPQDAARAAESITATLAEQARASLDAAVQRCGLDELGVSVERLVVEGDPSEALLRAADTENASLIAIGNRGDSATSRLLRGSVAHYTLHHATIPVAVIHP